MRLHLPKPLHGWRAFAGEVGVIVLGVLIALGLGQLVQNFNDRANASDARDAIRSEVAADVGGLAAFRITAEDCIAKRLQAVGDYLDAASKGARPAPAHWLGKPAIWSIETFRWDAASQSGRVSLLSMAEQAQLSGMYGLLKAAGEYQMDEQKWWAQLRSIEGQPSVSPNTAEELRIVLSEARNVDWLMRLAFGQMRDGVKAMGIEPAGHPRRSNATPTICIPIDTPRDQAAAIFRRSSGLKGELW